jgi:hypothetical protein
MEASLLDAWWMRWAVLAAGVAVSWVAWNSSDDAFRGYEKRGGFTLFDDDEYKRESRLKGGINRFAFILVGAALVVAAIFWAKVKSWLHLFV